MSDMTTLAAAQDSLEAAIVEAIETFRSDNPELKLDGLYVNLYAGEGEKSVTSTVSATIEGARVARSS
jgi:hypothetical protein